MLRGPSAFPEDSGVGKALLGGLGKLLCSSGGIVLGGDQHGNLVWRLRGPALAGVLSSHGSLGTQVHLADPDEGHFQGQCQPGVPVWCQLLKRRQAGESG